MLGIGSVLSKAINGIIRGIGYGSGWMIVVGIIGVVLVIAYLYSKSK